MHLFIWPKLLPSQDSPGSSLLLPQSGACMQSDMSSLQLSVHFRVPPMKLVYCVQLLIVPNVSLSHCSPCWFIISSPQTGLGWHADLSTVMPSLFLALLSNPTTFFALTLKKYCELSSKSRFSTHIHSPPVKVCIRLSSGLLSNFLIK